jgi:phosphoserine aminotransferase
MTDLTWSLIELNFEVLNLELVPYTMEVMLLQGSCISVTAMHACMLLQTRQVNTFFFTAHAAQFVVKVLLTSLNDEHCQIHENVLENNYGWNARCTIFI